MKPHANRPANRTDNRTDNRTVKHTVSSSFKQLEPELEVELELENDLPPFTETYAYYAAREARLWAGASPQVLALRDRIARELGDPPVRGLTPAQHCEAAMADVRAIHDAAGRAELRRLRIDWHRQELAELERAA